MIDQTSHEPPKYDWQTPKPQFDVGRVLANSFKGLFANSSVLIVALIIVISISLISTIVTTLTVGNSISPDIINSGSFGSAFWAITLLTNIIIYLSFIWFQLVILQTTYNYIFGISDSVSVLLLKALKLCIPMAFLAFLYGLVCVLGFYALFIGFVFVWPGWALIGPVLVYEKETSYFGSFGRAWSLARRYKRWLFLILLIVSIISIVIFTLTTSMMLPLLGYTVFDPSTTVNAMTLSWQMILYTIISSIGGFFCYGLFASSMAASYAELKTIKGETGEHIASVFD
jgi:hypothetical protein